MVSKSIILTILLLFIASLIYPGTRLAEPGEASGNNSEDRIQSIYQSLNDTTLKAEAFSLAMQGYTTLRANGAVIKEQLLTIIDYSLPSSRDRFFVIDLIAKNIVFKTLVAHGRNTGELYANHFSNKTHSYQSALGFFITGKPYIGSQGYSLQMNGVDTGFNDNAAKRSIVIHGANYATVRYIKLYGRLGRSLGCPALPPDVNMPVIDLIKEGSLVFSYYPDKMYLSTSKVLGWVSKEPDVSADL